MRTSRAFTLVEAAVVVVVVGVLAAVSLAGLNALQNRTSADRAKTELRQAASSLASYQMSRGVFPLDAPTLNKIEPGLTFVPGAESTKPGEIAIGTQTRSGSPILGLATVSKSGDCLTLTQPTLKNDSIAITSAKFAPSATAPCSAATALAQSQKEW